MTIEIRTVDYHDAVQASQLFELLDAYARDPMGGGEPLQGTTRQQLASALAGVHGAFSLIAYVDDQPAGLANCFTGFSTFQCRPLINVHDLVVLPDHRGVGLSQRLLQAIETEARRRGCGKITLEVLTGNTVARNAYRKFGFAGYQLDPAIGRAELWQKTLDSTEQTT